MLIRLDLDQSGSLDYGREKIEQVATLFDVLVGVPERERIWRATPAPRKG